MKKLYAINPLFSEEFRKLEEKEEEFLSKGVFEFVDEDDESDNRPYQVVNGVAMYSIRGKMAATSNFFTKVFGIPTYEDMGNALAMMYEDEEVEKVLIDFSTPGGPVSGISDLSETWKQLNAEKQITVHTSGMLASAGLWLASNSNEIYASEVAEVGSIGVILQHVSYEASLKKDGIKVTEIKSAPLKAVGSPAKDLTDEELAYLQKKVDETSKLFEKQIYLSRPQVSAGAFTGETFIAHEALKMGLIDGVKTFSEVFSATMGVASNNDSKPRGFEMKKKVTASMYEAAVAAGADPNTLEIVSQEEYDAWMEEQNKGQNAAAENEGEGAEASESEGVEATENEGEGAEAVEGESVEQLEAVKTELAEALASIESLEATIEDLEAKLEASKSDPLKKIAVERISVMRVALGLQKIDLSEFPVESIIAEYEALDKQFKAAFKVGGHTKPSKEDDNKVKKAAVTSIDRAKLRAVGV